MIRTLGYLIALGLTWMAAPALAQPAALYGPLPVVDHANCTTSGSPPVTTCAAVPGVHYIVSASDYAANADVLAPYRDATQTNLQNVLAGDNPASPTLTVAITFPDDATAQAVKAQLGQ